MRKIIFFVFLWSPCALLAQKPYLVKDVNTSLSFFTESSSPTEFVAHRNRTFFVATTQASGTELWSTDGTSAGTAIVADIIPGTPSSTPSGLRVVNGVLLFNARDVNHGVELWTSDGTAAGTRMLLDANPGPNSAVPVSKTLYRNRMLMSLDDGAAGRELWITDGTAAGTRMVRDINPGTASSSPASMVVFGDHVYFSAAGGLWKTDGTEAGTVKVSTLSIRSSIAVAGTQLFIEGTVSGTNWEPWVSDGTEAGTRMVTDILPGPRGALGNFGFAVLGNRVLFLANDDARGREMWISDGTAAGTRIVRDLVPGAQGMWDFGSTPIRALGERAFFVGRDDEHGNELWVTDGSESGTVLFADLTPGTASSSLALFTALDGKMYFVANGSRLWVTDGTAAGTRPLSDSSGNAVTAGGIWPVEGKLYFAGGSALHGTEPWVTDGTAGGTRMIANLEADVAPSSSPRMLTAAGELMFFYAIEGIRSPTTNVPEWSLWRTDGTAGGTFKLMESGQHPAALTAAGPFVFFKSQVNSQTLLISDGTIAGTKPADAFLHRFGGFRIGGLFPFGETLFATVYVASIGSETSLWTTAAVANAPAIRLGSDNPYGLIEVAGRFLFYARTAKSVHDRGLWITDGTPAGTYAVIPELNADYQSVSALASAGGAVFFLKAVRDEKTKLWKSDGTFDGTTVVKELPLAGAASSEILAAGRRLFFVLNGALWTSDGTEAGTVEVTKVQSRGISGNQLTSLGDRVLFVQSGDSGVAPELWSSDGTPGGTRLLATMSRIDPRPKNIDGAGYFAGVDEVHGNELWTTDGTPEGTKLHADVNPGPASSYPSEITRAGKTIYFQASTDATGSELWALPLTQPGLSVNDARAAEAVGATVRFTVTLDPAAEQTVTVGYATSDGTARAGQDYDAASGTLTFAPGETTRTIEIRVRTEGALEGNETFFIALRDALGARVVKGEGFGIVEDAEQSADVSMVSAVTSEGQGGFTDSVSVSNHGPRAATDIAVTITSTPVYSTSRCMLCRIAQLPSGTSAAASGDSQYPFQQVFLSATVAARQRDPQAANNSVTWTINGDRTMIMNAAFLTPGATATVTVNTFFIPGAKPVVSAPSVISVPATITQSTERIATFTVTALQVGTSTISIGGGQYPLLVHVVPSGSSPRWPGAMRFAANTTTRIDTPMTLTATPSGTAPISGATATGTVIVRSGGQELARQTVSVTGPTSIPVYFRSTGSGVFTVSYSGDANFLPQTADLNHFVHKGKVSITGGLERVTGAAGTFMLKLKATGSPVVPATGLVAILNGSTEIARVPLVPSAGGSSAQVTLTNLPPSPTITVNYLGDTLYDAGSQQLRVIESRRRSAHH